MLMLKAVMNHDFWRLAEANPRLRLGEPDAIRRALGMDGFPVGLGERDAPAVIDHMTGLGFAPDDRSDWPLVIRNV